MKGKSCKEMARWATSALILCCVLGIVGAGTSSINDHSCHGESIFRPHVGLDEAAESTNRWSHRPGVESHIHHRSQFCESFLQRRGRVCGSGPGHSFQAIREQIFGSENTSADAAPMNGFAQQATSLGGANMSQTVMNGFRLEVVPVYNTLVSEFAVFDRWFASVLASTQPNRLYVHSATSHGATSNIPKLLANGYPQKTIFESIDESGLSFGIYYQNILATLFYRNLRKLKYIGNFHSYSAQFKAHASKGKLPNYVVVEQRYMDSKLFPANDMLKLRDTFDLVLDWFWIPLQRH